MKKNWIFFLLFVTAFIGPWKPAFSAPLESDLRTKTVVLHSTWSVAAGISTHTVLISLSNSGSASTSLWPSPTNQNGYVNITNIFVTTDKLAASTCTVRIGVVTAIDSSTGSVKYFFDLQSGINVSNSINNVFYESDNSYRCLKVIPPTPNSGIDGTTPYLISNENLSGSTIFQTDVMLPSVNKANGGTANVLPGLGDIVMSVTDFDATNAIGITVDLLYHLDSR